MLLHTFCLVVLFWNTTRAYTKYSPVLNRLNYGLAFNQGPELDIVSGRWLHLYRLVLPQFPKRMRFSTSGLCPITSYVNGLHNQGSPEEAFNKCLHQLVLGHAIPETCYAPDNVVLKPVDKCRLTAVQPCLAEHSLLPSLFTACSQAVPQLSPILSRVQQARDACSHLRSTYDAYAKIYTEYRARHKSQTDEITYITTVAARQKRAFIDISSPLSKLFGIGRQVDIDKLTGTINAVNDRVDVNAKFTHHLYDHTIQLAKSVEKQFNDTHRLIDDVHSEVLSILQQQQSDKNLELIVKWSTSMTTFQGLYQDILSQVSRILYAVKMLLLGHLTPDLIPLPEARLALTQLHTKLQEHYDTYTTPIRTPQQFYQNTEFYVTTREHKLYVGIFIPISHVSHHFQLYQIRHHPYPLTHNSQHMAELDSTETLIAISEDRQHYYYVQPQDLVLHCQYHTGYLCFYTPTLHHVSTPTCEHAIMTNQIAVVHQTCSYHVIHQSLIPNIYHFDHSSYIVTKVSQYRRTCNGVPETRHGCFYCLVKLHCDCEIQIGSSSIQALFDSCSTFNTFSVITYPINAIVAKYLANHSQYSTEEY